MKPLDACGCTLDKIPRKNYLHCMMLLSTATLITDSKIAIKLEIASFISVSYAIHVVCL